MKLEVVKYVPNFVDAHRTAQIVEINGPLDSIYDVWAEVDYLRDKIGKLNYRFNTFTQSIIMYDSPSQGYLVPIAFVNILEL